METKQFKEVIQRLKQETPKEDIVAQTLIKEAETVLAELVIYDESKDKIDKAVKQKTIRNLIKLISNIETYITNNSVPDNVKLVRDKILHNVSLTIYGVKQPIVLDSLKPIVAKNDKKAMLIYCSIMNNEDVVTDGRKFLKPQLTKCCFIVQGDALGKLLKDIGEEMHGKD